MVYLLSKLICFRKKKMEENKLDKNTHQGHRERLRQKVKKYGIDSLAEHEVLELILFYAIPRKNTNDIAHRLIKRFGSLSFVLEATEDQLMTVEGVSHSTAFLLKSIPEICSFYLGNKKKNGMKKFCSCSQAYAYLAPKFIGKTKESFLILFLTSANKVLGYEFVSEGLVSSTNVEIRKVYELCIKYNASRVLLAHNHPSGDPFPSSNDFIATKKFVQCLKNIQVDVVDHMVFGDGDYYSMKGNVQYEYLFV